MGIFIQLAIGVIAIYLIFTFALPMLVALVPYTLGVLLTIILILLVIGWLLRIAGLWSWK